MNILLGTPPLEKKNPNLLQNRQFRYFSQQSNAYPVLMAYLATILRNQGNEVHFIDGSLYNLTWDNYLRIAKYFKPDLVIWETKTPVYDEHLELMEKFPFKVKLIGDHVRTPHFDNSKPLPVIDRSLVPWKPYAYNNGNFKFTPGTYTQFATGCWWGKCTFCSWPHNLFPNFKVIPVSQAMQEIDNCAKLGIKEIFDDSDTFPVGDWLSEFCKELKQFNKKEKTYGRSGIVISCNMRGKGLQPDAYKEMAESGFRCLLIGLESSSVQTKFRLRKGESNSDIERTCKRAKDAGLEVHLTTMVGFPWETRQDAKNTISFTKKMFRRGIIDSLQATLCIPYPGTPLFEECKREGWLLTDDFRKYDMSQQVIKTEMTNNQVFKLIRSVYKSCLHPSFIIRKLSTIRRLEDVQWLWMATKKWFGHIGDFK